MGGGGRPGLGTGATVSRGRVGARVLSSKSGGGAKAAIGSSTPASRVRCHPVKGRNPTPVTTRKRQTGTFAHPPSPGLTILGMSHAIKCRLEPDRALTRSTLPRTGACIAARNPDERCGVVGGRKYLPLVDALAFLRTAPKRVKLKWLELKMLELKWLRSYELY